MFGYRNNVSQNKGYMDRWSILDPTYVLYNGYCLWLTVSSLFFSYSVPQERNTQRYFSLKMAEWKLLMFHIYPCQKAQREGSLSDRPSGYSTVKHDSLWTLCCNSKSIHCRAKRGPPSTAGRGNLEESQIKQKTEDRKPGRGTDRDVCTFRYPQSHESKR